MTGHGLLVLAYSHHHHSGGGRGLFHLFGLLAALSTAVRVGRFFLQNPVAAVIFCALGYLVYRWFTRSRRGRSADA